MVTKFLIVFFFHNLLPSRRRRTCLTIRCYRGKCLVIVHRVEIQVPKWIAQFLSEIWVFTSENLRAKVHYTRAQFFWLIRGIEHIEMLLHCWENGSVLELKFACGRRLNFCWSRIDWQRRRKLQNWRSDPWERWEWAMSWVFCRGCTDMW